MLEFLPGPSDVLALKISDRISAADLDEIMNRLESVMSGDGKVHIFVETQGISSLELAGMPAYMTRAMPLFGKLHRFGRVAVVADQAWIRFWTRFESAMLPFISYKVFLPEQRDEALDWVRGDSRAAA